MNLAMIRTLVFLLATLLALPAQAHTYDSRGCVSVSSLDGCSVAATDMADLLDTTQDREDVGSTNIEHCLLHCVAIASDLDFDCLELSDNPVEISRGENLQENRNKLLRPPDTV